MLKLSECLFQRELEICYPLVKTSITLLLKMQVSYIDHNLCQINSFVLITQVLKENAYWPVTFQIV